MGAAAIVSRFTTRLAGVADGLASGALFTTATTGGIKKKETATEKATVGRMRDAFIGKLSV
ncbi:hypothetical protein SLNSH_10215 [Alsobacter soli]|uniref:Uncharacterized protein n=1 Tax=Alsobacter soli TaxID=2109933 RepID=A0A2T1HUI2_9HYPH|nr:hypothetical protein SLNSH_10215 [Alsobacter soli]